MKKKTTRRSSTMRKSPVLGKGAAQAFWKAGGRALRALGSAYARILAAVRPFRVPSRRLRALETLALPNKQTISLVQVDGQEFLVGGSANSVVLLAKLEIPQPHRRTRSKSVPSAPVAASLPVKVVVAAPAKAEPLVASFATNVQ
jgi:hypothetical protein